MIWFRFKPDIVYKIGFPAFNISLKFFQYLKNTFAVFRLNGTPKDSLSRNKGKGTEGKGYDRCAAHKVKHHNINTLTNLRETEWRLNYVNKYCVDGTATVSAAAHRKRLARKILYIL